MNLNTNSRFAAIDFETADHGRDSACSLAVVLVEGVEIVERHHFMIRPPRQEFVFTYLHGIAWEHVKDEPTFAEQWPKIEKLFAGVEFVAAHNAEFDWSVLKECCRAGKVPTPMFHFICTVAIARKVWKLHPAKLPDVCRHLNIPLDHHDAESDASACANIVIAARKAAGFKPAASKEPLPDDSMKSDALQLAKWVMMNHDSQSYGKVEQPKELVRLARFICAEHADEIAKTST